MSWVASLFSAAQTPRLAPTSPNQSTVFSEVQEYQHDNTGALRQSWSQEHAQPMDEEEEAARSPYWHV